MKYFSKKTFLILMAGVIFILLFSSFWLEKGDRPINPIQFLREPCPETHNCISTMYPQDLNHFLPALPFRDSFKKSKGIIIDILDHYYGAEIIEQTGCFVYAEFTIPIFGFLDDVMFYFDKEEGIIHFRSSSRIGNGDLGVNRRRMKKISHLYLNYNPEKGVKQ